MASRAPLRAIVFHSVAAEGVIVLPVAKLLETLINTCKMAEN